MREYLHVLVTCSEGCASDEVPRGGNQFKTLRTSIHNKLIAITSTKNRHKMSSWISIYTMNKISYHYGNIAVDGPNDVKWLDQPTGFKCYTHTISKTVGNKRLQIRLTSTTTREWYGWLKFCRNGTNGKCQEEPLSYDGKGGDGKVHVYFYGGTTGSNSNGGQGGHSVGSRIPGHSGDPRPLLLCFNGSAYKPKDKSKYDSEWVKVDGITKCPCDSSGNADSKLLDALVEVVGELNTVNLKEYPDNGGQNCSKEYEVHTFQGKKIQIQVKKEDVNGAQSCYKMLIHTHNGIKGIGTGSGFRLGNITYDKSGVTGSIDYTKNGDPQNKYFPLISVTVYYFYNEGQYQYPVFIVLEFKKGDGVTTKELYKLSESSEKSMKWEIDSDASGAIGSKDLVEYFNQLRSSLQKVIKIQIDKQSDYALMASEKGGRGEFQQLGTIERIEVQEDRHCSALKAGGYRCYRHKLTDPSLAKDLRYIGGVKFYITGKNSGGNDITIPVFSDENEIQPLKCIYYNKFMGDIFVCFYHGNGTNGSTDTVPLMLFYNGQWYRPEKRDTYFTKWFPDLELKTTIDKPCQDCDRLADELDKINLDLNRIDLTQNSGGVGTTTSYGLKGDPGEGQVAGTFCKDRVEVKEKQPGASGAYTRIAHRTVNGFRIGDIYYGGKDITGGIQVNGSPEKIVINGGTDHTFFSSTNKPNTVVVYYSSISDKTYQLPQLIVILNTTEAIKGDTEPITGSGTNYGYYILTNNGTEGDKEASGYKYEWREVTEQVTLNDETEFSLLNAVVILLERKDKSKPYGEDDIKGAMTNSPTIRSPGNDDGVNRLTQKTINVRDVTGDRDRQCIQSYGYKVYTHDFQSVVKPSRPLESLSSVTLIAGIRFLVPSEIEDEYKEVKLCGKDAWQTGRCEKVDYLYHSKDHKVRVYFYTNDPRPLLLCYNKRTYRPLNKDKYFEEWVQVKGVKTCKFTAKNNCEPLIKALVCVSNFLNPVNIHKVPSNGGEKNSASCEYQIHKFGGKPICIKVTLEAGKNGFCYDKYIHTHNGTGKDGTGFRLGTITYGSQCIQENGKKPYKKYGKCITAALEKPPGKSLGASEVVVYYYKGDDTCLSNPLLVTLKNNGQYKPYYELLKRTGRVGGPKRYTKGRNGLNLTQTGSGSELVKVLDKILWKHTIIELWHKQLSSGGYRCYKASSGGRKDKGNGLTFGIYADGLKFNNWSKKEQVINIKNGSQDGCKGDIYVYFYGDDPRPLMLCYNGEGYRPQGMDGYTQAWTKVDSVKPCECTPDTAAKDLGPLLSVLYDVSMFMNPVKLAETRSAGSTLRRKGKPGKEPTHPYLVHDYGPTTVQVTISGLDLHCYKRYTHMPAKPGYRLGNVQWNGQPATNYDKSKQLISVSLYYYMYDKEHRNPLILELGFKGELSEYYRLKDKVESDKEPTWVQIKSKEEQDRSQGSGPGANGGSSTDKADDAEFIREAHRIEELMNVWDKGMPHFPGDYWSLYRELQALIEGKAYKVRTNLKIEKPENPTADDLILATADNCMEESIMGYLVGGGALGLAGGGVWKSTVWFIMLFIKV